MPKSVREATKVLIELRTLSIQPNELLHIIIELMGCDEARIFEKNIHSNWKELGRVEASPLSPASYESLDSRQCQAKEKKYPQQLFSTLIADESNKSVHILNNTCTAFALDGDIFKKQNIETVFIVSIKQEDGSTWIVYFSSSNKNFFHDYLDEDFLELFTSSIQNKFWQLWNLLGDRYVEYKDKSLIHDLRNSDQAKGGVVYLIKEHCDTLARNFAAVQQQDTKNRLERQLKKITKLVGHLEGELDNDLERLQSRLDGIRPNVTIVPSPLRLRFKDPNESSASHQLVSEFIRKIVNELAPIAKRYSKPIELKIDERLTGLCCQGLLNNIKMIVHNLLNNAIQHGAVNSNIDIFFNRIVKKEATEGEIDFEFVISNQIPEPKSESFFKTLPRKFSGSHLGQHNIKDCMQLLTRAEVRYETDNNRYLSHFSFALEKTDNLEKKQQAFEELSALIVEDNKMNIAFITRVLSRKNFRCEVATTADEAISQIDKNDFNLIFIDGTLKDNSSGLELAKELNGKIKSALIWMSGNELNDNDAHYFDKTLIKPFKPKEINAIVEELMSCSQNTTDSFSASRF